MPTPVSFGFQGCQGRRVTAAFDGRAITSNAGALLLTELFIESWPGRLAPSRLVLDIDSTDDAVHGRQEGRFYHG